MRLNILVLISGVNQQYTMVNRVVSTKMTEEEHGRIVELCNDIGISVSAMVKQAIRDRMKKEEKERKRLESQMKKVVEKPVEVKQKVVQTFVSQTNNRSEIKNEDRYLYF